MERLLSLLIAMAIVAVVAFIASRVRDRRAFAAAAVGRGRDATAVTDRFSLVEAYAETHGISSDDLHRELGAHMAHAEGHKLGGYPLFVQGDPRNDAERELLLQLDSQDGLMWSDSGVGKFFIEPALLARADFSRVLYTWDGC